MPRVDGQLTWAFEFEGREYFEGLRTLSTNDIDKPILNALRLFSMLSGARIALAINSSSAPSGLEVRGVAARADSALTLLLSWHHDDWDVSGEVSGELELSGLLPNHRYRLARFRVDHDHANAFTAWRELGEPQSPDRALLERLHAAALLQPDRGELTSDAEGRARLSVHASIHSERLVRFEPD